MDNKMCVEIEEDGKKKLTITGCHSVAARSIVCQKVNLNKKEKRGLTVNCLCCSLQSDSSNFMITKGEHSRIF